MSQTIRYEIAAPTWSTKAKRFGYSDAYVGFFDTRVRATGSVLDVGAGTGTFSLSWIKAGGSKEITLLDPSRAMLEQARLHFDHIGLHPTITHSAFESFQSATKFDAILASHVVEHFEDPHIAFAKFAELLSPGGRLYLTVSKPHWCNWLIWLRFRHRWFRPEVVAELARDAGLINFKLHKFLSGPPSRTSYGYVFTKP